MAAPELENPAPINTGENFNKIKEKYIKSILMQLHQAIRAQDYLGKSLGDLVALAAANEPNEQIKFILAKNFERVADERIEARRAMRKIYKIIKNKKHITQSASKIKLIIHILNLLRALNVIYTIYLTLGEINSIYYNNQTYNEIIYKLRAMFYFTKQILLLLLL